VIVVRGIPQGSLEWLQLRVGIPTASRMDSIITPATRKFSKAADAYAIELITERITGQPIDFDRTDWMGRGTGLEPEARKWYSFNQEVEVEEVTFCYTDDKSAGCSPDGLVGDDGILELKCPSAKVHIGHLLGKTNPASVTQVQGQLWVTDREWVDVVSYCPGLPPVLIRTVRDESFLADIDACMVKFQVGLQRALQKIQGLGVIGRIEGFGEDDNDGLIADLYASIEEAKK
jgi:hypothetical protein